MQSFTLPQTFPNFTHAQISGQIYSPAFYHQGVNDPAGFYCHLSIGGYCGSFGPYHGLRNAQPGSNPLLLSYGSLVFQSGAPHVTLIVHCIHFWNSTEK